MHGARLHRLVVPEDRVRADAALAVVDDRALVVGAQQHHRAVELEQLLLAEAVDLAVLVEDAAKLVTRPPQPAPLRAGGYYPSDAVALGASAPIAGKKPGSKPGDCGRLERRPVGSTSGVCVVGSTTQLKS